MIETVNKRSCASIRKIVMTALLVSMTVQFLVPAFGTTAKAGTKKKEGPDPNFHIYLAIGQSNMEGRAQIEEIDKTCDDGFLVMNTADNMEGREVGVWYPAVPPLAHAYAGLGMADYFGRTMLEKKKKENPDIRIGVIVVAVAGSSIRMFDRDAYQTYLTQESPKWLSERANKFYSGNPYQRLVDCAKLAQKDGVIKGIILHQGETDEKDAAWPERVQKVYENLLCDLSLSEDTPLLAGQVLQGGANQGANANVERLPELSDRFFVVSSEGLTEPLADGQNLHFTAEEYRKFGARYAKQMLSSEGWKTQVKYLRAPDLSKVKKLKKGVLAKDDKGNVYRITAAGKKAEVSYETCIGAAANSVSIPDEVVIGDRTFQVTKISDGAFLYRRNLKKVTIGKNVRSIGKEAFFGCSGLKKLTVETALLNRKAIGKNALRGIHKKAVLWVSAEKTAAYKRVFRNKGWEKTMKIRALAEETPNSP